MNQYIKGDKVIYATKEAFEYLYKSRGFTLLKENDTEETADVEVDLHELNKEQLQDLLTHLEIPFDGRWSEEKLIELAAEAL